MTKVCDYHDLPLLCDTCGLPGVLEMGPRHKPSRISQGESDFHAFRPVHRIPDPEGIEGTQVVPCGLA